MSDIKKAGYSPIPEGDAPPPAYDAEISSLVDRTNVLGLRVDQPTPTAQMSVAGPRNAKQLPIGLDNKRSWNHGLCSCYQEPLTTLNAICCPCIIYSSNHSRLIHLTATGESNPSPQHIGLFCALYAISPQFFGIGQVMMQCFSRLQTRQRYGIRGDVVQDALVAAFCYPCSLVQESREIEEEEIALREGGEAPETFYRDEPTVEESV